MSDATKQTIVQFSAIVFLLAVGGLMGALLVHALTRDSWKAAAIEAGVAEYVVDSRSGAVEFKWKEPKE